MSAAAGTAAPAARGDAAGGTLLLAICGGLWGSSLLFISEALAAFDPFWIAVIRSVVSAGALALWLWVAGPAVPAAVRRDLVRRPGLALAAGTAGFAAPMIFVAVGAEQLPTGLVAVVIACSPLLVALVAVWIAPDDGVGARGTLGLLIGLAGVTLAVGGESVAAPDRLVPILLLLGAAASTAIYPMVMRRGYRGAVHPTAIVVHATAGSAVASALLLPFSEAPVDVGLRPVAAVLILSVLCTALPFAMHAALVERLGSVRAGTANYFIPVTGVLIGVTVLGEHLRLTALLGLALILAGVWLATRPRPRIAVATASIEHPPSSG